MISIEEWWFNKLDQGEIFPDDDWPTGVLATDLVADYHKHVWPKGSAVTVAAATTLGKFLYKVCAGIENYRISTPTGPTRRVHCYGFPRLWKARRSWEFYVGEDIWTGGRGMSD